ncbi:hypothetical protein [Rubrobacter calidifluminis]|uniref:hypothetical protein n=1 Tax=Rubrobacter calidifluminis TaxID=1392640 RepID=UPI002360C1FD|nr:hypothetical protein [Rubrobacter calidifluminis]
MPRRKLSWLFSWAYPPRARREVEERLEKQLREIERRRQVRVRMRKALTEEDFLRAMNILEEERHAADRREDSR